MPMVSGSQVKYRFIKEVTPGVTPTVNPGDMTDLVLMTDARQLSSDQAEIASQSVTPDGFAPLSALGIKSVAGSFGFEVAEGTIQDSVPIIAHDDWTILAAVTTAVNLEFVAPAVASDFGGTIRRAAGSFITDNWRAGDTILVSGAADDENNGYRSVMTVSALDLIVSQKVQQTGNVFAVQDIVVAADAAGITCTGPDQYIDQVQGEYALTVEREMGALFTQFVGVNSNGWSLGVTTDSTVAFTFDTVGVSSADGSTLDPTPGAQDGSNPYSPVEALAFLDGVPFILTTDFTINPTANITPANVTGRDTSAALQFGTFEFDATMTVFFDDTAVLPAAEDVFEMSVLLRESGADSWLSLYFPVARILSRPATVGADNVTQALTFSIGKGSTTPAVRFGNREA